MPNFIENDIVCKDSKKLTEFIKPETVDITITSPPYRNAIDYAKHANGINQSENKYYRASKEWNTEKYLKTMRKIFDEVYDVTKPGGFCCIVIGYELHDREIIPLPSLLLTTLLRKDKQNRNWKLREEIIWNKVTAGRKGAGNRFGVTIKNPYPKYYYTNIMHEYIFVLSKGDKIPHNLTEDTLKKANKLPMNEIMYKEVANSFWNITPVPPSAIPHPCPYPEQIPWRLILLYTYPNDLVLDPFNGSGQTTKVAKILGRRYIGVDTEQKYVNLAKERIKKEKLGLTKNILVQKHEKIEWKDELEKYGFK